MNEFTLRGGAPIGGSFISDAAVCARDGIIIYAGEAKNAPKCGEVTEADIIMPGFVDIHCHSGGDVWFWQDAAAASRYHLSHGTTAMCATLYRDLGHEGILEGIETVRSAMRECPNIYGVHLEGPYLNPRYGSMASDKPVVCRREEYLPLLESGIIRQVTVAPEVEGAEELIKELCRRGIIAAMGHSNASPEQVEKAVSAGAKNVTHLFDATGASVEPARWDGTIETDFNCAALCHEGLTYEIICDKGGVHVRPEMLRLAVRAAGADNIIGITDACGGGGEGDDVNFVDGELTGSKLTMNKVAKNFASLGYSLTDVAKFTSSNPARLLGLDSEIGSLEVGKRADIVLLDKEFEVIRTFISKRNG